MAVHAQYPSNVFLFNNRGEQQETVNMQQSHPPNSAAAPKSNGKGLKRAREAARPPPPQAAAAPFMNVSHHPVSTGLRLAPDEPSNQSISAALAGELAEMDMLLVAQSEALRVALAERQRSHHLALLAAAEELTGQRMRNKEAELEAAVRRSVELEDRVARLRAESMAWQARAAAEQTAAVALQAELQRVMGRGGEAAEVEDEESGYVDPDRVGREGACRVCCARAASVVVLPCRHLSLCSGCHVDACPVCGGQRKASVEVFLSSPSPGEPLPLEMHHNRPN